MIKMRERTRPVEHADRVRGCAGSGILHRPFLGFRASPFLLHWACVIRHFLFLCAIAVVSPALAQEVVGRFEFTPATPAYEVWGAGTQRRAFADEWLPSCFERTLVLDELVTDQPLQWIFTGPRAGVTIAVATNEVRLAHRFYDSFGFFEVAGKPARHPEWRSADRVFPITGSVQNVTLRLDGRLQLVLLVNGRELHRQNWIQDLSRHQIQVEDRDARLRGCWLRPAPVEVAVRVCPDRRHQTMIGFGGITPPPAYAMLSDAGRARWWQLLAEYNLLIQREYPSGSRLNSTMDNWDRAADAAPHYYGDNFPNGELSDFGYNRRIRELGGQVWFEFWKLPQWAGTNVEKYTEAVVSYCEASKQRAGGPPDIVGIQNEVKQSPEQWRTMTLTVRQALDRAGFSRVKLHTADASTLKDGIEFLKGFRRSPEAWARLDFAATHCYDFQDYFTNPDGYDARIAEWNALTDGKPFLSTELCVNKEQWQADSYRVALAMGQLYHKNLVLMDAVAMCYCWTLLNVVQPSYGATRSLFVPDERSGFLPVASSHQLRVFGAYSRRIHRGMARLEAQSGHPEVLVCAFGHEGQLATLVAINRSTAPALVQVEWPGAVFHTLEIADPYHPNTPLLLADEPGSVLVSPGAIVSLSNVALRRLPGAQ